MREPSSTPVARLHSHLKHHCIEFRPTSSKARLSNWFADIGCGAADGTIFALHHQPRVIGNIVGAGADFGDRRRGTESSSMRCCY